jgi:acylphosphatase
MTANDDVRTVRVRVEGLVQGVGYRYFVLREARTIGVSGYVRNMPDGTVEAVASGPAGAVDRFVGRLRIGPSSALVSRVGVEEIEGAGPFDGFDVRF